MTCLSLGLTMIAGCGESAPAAAPLHQVKGKVVYKDASALSGMKIQFLPKTPTGRPATGDIKSDGTFELKSADGDGIPEGDYRVKLVLPPAAKGKVAKSSISSEYFDEDGMQLSATIKSDTTELPPFDLKPIAKTDAGRRSNRDND